jgi:hypothetical protein
MIRLNSARQRFRRAFSEQRLYRAPLGAHLGKTELVSPRARNHNEIDALRE